MQEIVEADHAMYKLMLVDDEPWVLYHLSQIISWQDYGFEIAAMCESGQEALALLEALHVDAIITDIRMDGMSGLHLIRLAREKRPNLEFIILSAYSDFQVAREALVLDVSQYLIKPLMERDVTEAALRLKERIQRKSTSVSIDSPALQQMAETYASANPSPEKKYYIFARDPGRIPAQADRLPITLQEFPNAILVCCSDWLSNLLPREARFGVSRYRHHLNDLPAMVQEACDSERYQVAFQEKNSLVADAQQILMRQYGNSEVIATLSNQLFVSDTYLRKLFNKYEDTSPSQLLKHIRIREATFLLRQTKASIQQVSEKIGYADYNYFGRVFKKEIGVSPEVYRNQSAPES